MPSPIAHIYYGQAYLVRHLSHDPGAFMRGTIFADIRYMLQLDRSRTHRVAISMAEVEAETDPWRQGWLFHNWLDDTWSDYFAQYGLDQYDPTFDEKFRVLKLIDDAQTHSLLEEAASEHTASLLEGGDEQVAAFEVSAEDANRWNRLMAELLIQRDAKTSRERILGLFQFPDSVIVGLEHEERRLEREKIWPARIRDCRRAIMGLL